MIKREKLQEKQIYVFVGLLLIITLIIYKLSFYNPMQQGSRYRASALPTPTVVMDEAQISKAIYENQMAIGRILPESLPEGWIPDPENRWFLKTLNGITYRVDFQLNNTEYLVKDGGFTFNLSLINTIQTKKGTTVYIVQESKDYIYVSSCKPTKVSACSVPYQNKLLFISLHTYRPGDQYPRELDFNAPGIGSIVKEFTEIVQSSNF